MKVLVTGGDGFLGNAVVKLLRNSDLDVLSLTRRTPSKSGYKYCDLAVPSSLVDLLKEVAPNCIVNLAATVDFSTGVLPTLYSVNSLCPAIMAEYCQRTKSYLIQASGIVAVGFQHAIYGESTQLHPDTDYGCSKLLAEQAILASGCSAAIIRFGGVFGSDGPQHLGLNRVISQAKSGVPPRIVGTGTAKRNYVYVADAAAMIRKCLIESINGVYYAGGETRSILQMFQEVCDVWIPGKEPILLGGEDGQDQLVQASPQLGITRSFQECLRDCS